MASNKPQEIRSPLGMPVFIGYILEYLVLLWIYSGRPVDTASFHTAMLFVLANRMTPRRYNRAIALGPTRRRETLTTTDNFPLLERFIE